ncbi:ras-associated and pleckstrin homology domains-containing protein 1-like [Sinocyclocheilus grahami]|uniref:ras-associated and pleckstrin homology domains-containing protein 1-like n=1 Tax=Sinocyclocheilus grahami TaxID=75366 RepID=UPI0007AD2436|nr:PREDICTED: ras-associated and pleckstrin homology domains-containing protein 1-like [Sinocyclocheilus grahami]
MLYTQTIKCISIDNVSDFATQHPQIQKKSQYIKYLCCDDVRTLHQWVNGIRIAKYGKQLYLNYQEAMRRTEAAHDWSSLSSSSIKSGSSSSSLPGELSSAARAGPYQFGALGKILASAPCIAANSTADHSHRNCIALT